MARLDDLKNRRAAAEAKLDAIIAGDTGFDASGDGGSITAATERYTKLIDMIDKQIIAEVARQPWQRRVQSRAT